MMDHVVRSDPVFTHDPQGQCFLAQMLLATSMLMKSQAHFEGEVKRVLIAEVK